MSMTFHGQRPFSRFWTRPVLKLMRRNGQTNPSRNSGDVSRPVWCLWDAASCQVTPDLANLSDLLDGAKCFASVRQHRWLEGVGGSSLRPVRLQMSLGK